MGTVMRSRGQEPPQRRAGLGQLPASALRPWPRTPGSATNRRSQGETLPGGGSVTRGLRALRSKGRARLGGGAGAGGLRRSAGVPGGAGAPQERGVLPRTYLGQPTALAYCTAVARPWRKAAWRPGTAASPISPASWSPRRERRGQRHRGTPAPPTHAARRGRGGTGGGVEEDDPHPRPLRRGPQLLGRAARRPGRLRRPEPGGRRRLQPRRQRPELREQPRHVRGEAQRHGGRRGRRQAESGWGRGGRGGAEAARERAAAWRVAPGQPGRCVPPGPRRPWAATTHPWGCWEGYPGASEPPSAGAARSAAPPQQLAAPTPVALCPASV